MPKYISTLWSLLHPIQAYRIRQHNKIVIARMKEAALRVCIELDSPDCHEFDHLTEMQMLALFEKKLQQAIFAVLTDEKVPGFTEGGTDVS